MNPFRCSIPSGLLLLAAGCAAGLGIAPPAQARTAAPSTCDGSWQVQRSSHPGQGSTLLAVAAVGADDVWAVGDVDRSGGQRPLIEHWDGSAWSVVPTPHPSTTSELKSVAAVSSTDVWAVGSSEALGKTLIEHWDGGSWSRVPSPSPGTTLNRLNGVAALAPDDIWAVGLETAPSGGEVPLAEHWDGVSWSAVETAPLPPNDGISELLGVSGTSPDDVWAVGDYGNTQGGLTTLAEHWDGTSWSIISTPSPTIHAQLNGVSAVSGTRAFAIGEGNLFPDDKVLALRWDGARWRSIPARDPAAPNDLVSLSVLAPGKGWAVGSTGGDTPLIERLTRGGWTTAATPPVPGGGSLAGVSTLSDRVAWAVGARTPPSGQPETLVEVVC